MCCHKVCDCEYALNKYLSFQSGQLSQMNPSAKIYKKKQIKSEKNPWTNLTSLAGWKHAVWWESSVNTVAKNAQSNPYIRRRYFSLPSNSLRIYWSTTPPEGGGGEIILYSPFFRSPINGSLSVTAYVTKSCSVTTWSPNQDNEMNDI